MVAGQRLPDHSRSDYRRAYNKQRARLYRILGISLRVGAVRLHTYDGSHRAKTIGQGRGGANNCQVDRKLFW
jgi:hypothetical protein